MLHKLIQSSLKTNVGVDLGINEHQGAPNDHQYLIWTGLKGGSCGSSFMQLVPVIPALLLEFNATPGGYL